MTKLNIPAAGIRIRQATLADLPALLQFEQGVIAAERPFDPTLKDAPVYYNLPALIASPDAELLVADSAGTLIGSGYARIEKAEAFLLHSHHAYLGFMYVAPEHRGKGVNQLILDALRQWARTRDISELRLDVYYDNEPALRAYEKAGFIRHMIVMRCPIQL